MNYISIKSALTTLDSSSKLRCIAHCERLFSTCNLAVFNPIVTPRCILYGEVLRATNLIPYSGSIIIDFNRNITSSSM